MSALEEYQQSVEKFKMVAYVGMLACLVSGVVFGYCASELEDRSEWATGFSVGVAIVQAKFERAGCKLVDEK